MSQNFFTSIPTAQVKTLRATPVQVIPAPGTGLYIVPTAIILRTKNATIPYINLLSGLSLLINNINVLANNIPAGILGYTSDQWFSYSIPASAAAISVASCENQAVFIKNMGLLELLSGDCTLEVQISCETLQV